MSATDPVRLSDGLFSTAAMSALLGDSARLQGMLGRQSSTILG